MPHATYTAEGGYFRVGGHGFDPGDTREVDAELADYLAGLEEFEVEGIDSADADDSDTDNGASEADADNESGFDIEEFLDDNVEPIAADIRAGEVDAHLDAIAETADRVTVQDAIGERRAELEG